MSEFYTDVEFANVFSLRGYGKKKDALKWLKDHGMDHAFEEDFVKCYRDVNPEYIGHTNYDPKNIVNNEGESFEDCMRREQRKTDAVDRRIKRMKNVD